MTISRITVLFFVLTVFQACSSDTPDVIKTKSGLYGSVQGKFLAKFPSKPKVIIQENKMGDTEFDLVRFQSNFSFEHVYMVTYCDYPPEIFSAWTFEDLCKKSAEMIVSQTELFTSTKVMETGESVFENTMMFKFFSNEAGNRVYAQVKYIRVGDRFYTILFSCARRRPEKEVIDGFMNSFKLYEKK